MLRRFPIWIRTIAVTLTVAMVYYFAGYRLVYSFVMHGAKQDAAFAIKHQGSLNTMTLSAEEYKNLKWTENGKEFVLNGQLFDLVKIEKLGKAYQLSVYDDKNETRWAKAMNDFVKCFFPSQHNKKQGPAEGLVSAFQKEYTPLHKVTVSHIPEAKTICFIEDKYCPSSCSIKPVWHPPAIC